ncbi:ATP-dependent 6-phosphofructokinase 5, chloroplastic isoform X3 [Triticum aestivum]|uniref:ATP-dependent 6-phosphofructokinase 5, chloroplastic isoform X3 n=1 Tax=Triticum aestivum TaxID=4565 RepID=UPI001D026365|nr:ATP-dependent 6-phosphofructokinase 5, chloroplastic-like isoform X3 [Triticum aestivum]
MPLSGMAIAFKASTSACTAQQLWGHPTRDQCQHGFTHLNERKSRKGSAALHARAIPGNLDLDFGDPSWKQKYQEDWDRRFSLPHITDVFDLEPRLTTFSLKKNRSPLGASDASSPDKWNGYVNKDDRALLKVINYASNTSAGAVCIDPDCSWVEHWVHRAGPRKEIYYEPEEVKAAIVTCGGLCPGLNDVIRQIVFTLEIYGVKNIVGIQFGYRGFFEKGLKEMPLSRDVVENINLAGGSFLGVSRGGAKTSEIVDSIQARRIDMLFVIGGNGSHAGANAIHEECRKRKLKVSVVAVPKTIDNDILFMDKTFGFDTAVEEAQRAINSAYIEARSAYHGVGLVKLMGRSTGFIAMHASLSSGQIDVCLIPEVSFTLDGEHGVLSHLEHLLETKGFCVVCVAEGAGQDLLQKSNATDASGNVILSDFGVHMQQKIKKHFKDIGVLADVKYIDPTYMVRACRANASDAILCTVLGQNAVHGAFAGFSGITSGFAEDQDVINEHEHTVSEKMFQDSVH